MNHSTTRRALLPALTVAMLLSLFVAAPVSAQGGRTVLQTDLTGTEEVTNDPACEPPTVCGDPDGTGFALIEIDEDAGTLCFWLEVSDIALPATGAHIHEAPPGDAGPIAVTLTPPDASGTSSGCVKDVDAALLADIAANPGDYYVNVHNAEFPQGAVRGQLEQAAMGEVMVMKHLCDDSIQTDADFAAVEAREQTNPKTPDSPFGSTVETVLACPTVVLPGDQQTAGAVAGGEQAFAFTVTDPTGPQTMAEAAYSGPDALCETQVEYDADRDGTLEANVCLDLSHYIFDALEGPVTVTETTPPPGTRFGALRFTPGTDDAGTLLSSSGGVIQLDTSRDEDAMVMLHVYNFVNLAAPTPTRPAATTIPNTSAEAGQASGGSVPIAPLLTAVLLGSAAVFTLARARGWDRAR